MLPIAEALRRERARRRAAALRRAIAGIGEEQWPPWPAAADGEYHAWVREHWSVLASDRFDALREVLGRQREVELAVLAQELADAGPDAGAARSCLAEFERPVWAEGEAPADWRRWLEVHWQPEAARELLRELEAAERTLAWIPTYREEKRARERAELAELEDLLRFDLSQEELAPLLEGRVTGIRGRYRLTGTWNEQQAGVTAADIDAP